jgi:hypothetical protein
MGFSTHGKHQRTEKVMNLELTSEELVFLQEALGWAKFRYEEVAGQYMEIKGWRETQYQPKMRMFEQLHAKLTATH